MVSNTGPLISLEKLRPGYDFIRQLYDTIIIPPGVLDEVAEGQFATPQASLQYYGIVDLIAVHAMSQSERLPEAAHLPVGEAQAMQLARELALSLLIEETVGRRVAQGLGISISGIAGQILQEKVPGTIFPGPVAVVGTACKAWGVATACLQRPLLRRFRFQRRLKPSVQRLYMTKQVAGSIAEKAPGEISIA